MQNLRCRTTLNNWCTNPVFCGFKLWTWRTHIRGLNCPSLARSQISHSIPLLVSVIISMVICYNLYFKWGLSRQIRFIEFMYRSSVYDSRYSFLVVYERQLYPTHRPDQTRIAYPWGAYPSSANPWRGECLAIMEAVYKAMRSWITYKDKALW